MRENLYNSPSTHLNNHLLSKIKKNKPNAIAFNAFGSEAYIVASNQKKSKQGKTGRNNLGIQKPYSRPFPFIAMPNEATIIIN